MSTEQEHPKKAFGWAARDSSGVFSPFKFSRRTGDKDVMFKVYAIQTFTWPRTNGERLTIHWFPDMRLLV
ncbi:hypothetical protein EV1_003766 [Malus domestica]